MGSLLEGKNLFECEKEIASLGKTPKEIARSLRSLLETEKSSSSEALRSLYGCMEKDFLLQNGGKVSLPRYGTKGALALLAVYIAYKNGAGPFPKHLLDEINNGDSQHLRHIRRRRGIKIAKRGRSEYYLEDLKLGEAFVNRHKGVRAGAFEEIKAVYGYRCATCGAKEGEPHHLPQYRQSKEAVVLHQGHMNPHGPLIAGNVIPQCQFCNRAYRNWVVFDINGRVIGVSNWEFVLKSIKKSYLRITEESRKIVREIIDLLTEQLDRRLR